MLGDIVAAVALTVLVYQRTASPFLAGVTFTLAFVPYLFSGALLSGLVDRVPPRRLMVACDLISAAIVALMALSAVPVPVLLALLFVLGLISPVSAGTRTALARDRAGRTASSSPGARSSASSPSPRRSSATAPAAS